VLHDLNEVKLSTPGDMQASEATLASTQGPRTGTRSEIFYRPGGKLNVYIHSILKDAMEQIVFFPFDITYKIKEGKPIIIMYGKTDNTQICVQVSQVEPYFYVHPTGNMPELIKDIKKTTAAHRNDVAQVTSVQQVEKKINGKATTLLKVFTSIPAYVPALKRAIELHHSVKVCYEYDILFKRRFLMDNGITPLLPLAITGRFVQERSRVPVFEAKTIKPADIEDTVQTRILSVDIETYAPDFEMNPEKNPIIMIAVYGKNPQTKAVFKKVVTWKRFPTVHSEIEFVAGEYEMLQRFKELVDEFKPDIITGYNTDGFDFPYIATRAKKYKINFDIGLDYSSISVKNRSTDVAITGIVHLDLLQFVRRVLGRSLETNSYKLDNVAQELLNEQKIPVDIADLAGSWDRNKGLEQFALYNLHDARITYNLCTTILPNIEELVKIVGLPLFDISRMSFSQLVENYILTQCKNSDEVAPNKPDSIQIKQRRVQSYEGGFVFQPTPGLYNNIAIFDFRSLYPTIIISHNITPSAYRCSCCHEIIAETGDWFCTKKKGFLSIVLEDIVTRRMRIKEIIKSSSEKNILLEARSTALKLLANSFYGYLGFAPARWYSFESARNVTALGREHIQQVIGSAKKHGFSVVYGDTDSIFMKLGETQKSQKSTISEKTKDDAIKFINRINAKLPGMMELEYEGYYPAALFVGTKSTGIGAKKRYALLDNAGRITIKGFEAVRRNTSRITKEVQEKVLEILLKEEDVQKARTFVKKTIEQLRNRTLPAERVVITTQIKKPLDAYNSIGPHVAVARRMVVAGTPVSPGTVVQYVVIEGKGIIRERARLVEELDNNNYDVEYYINNQIIPAVEKIFEVFDISIEDDINKKDQTSLNKFFA
jgi:DNA polymerase, archaea type